MYSRQKLLEMISSEKTSERYDAVEWLRISQESSPEIIAALEKAANDPDHEVAERAKLALQAEAHQKMAEKLASGSTSDVQGTVSMGEVVPQGPGDRLNIDFTADQLKQLGWKIDRRAFRSLKPDLVVLKRFGTAPWYAIIKMVPVLDVFALNRLQPNIDFTYRTVKSNLLRKNFCLYLVAGKVTQQALHYLSMDILRVRHFSQKGSGTRRLLVFDVMNRQSHGPFPAALPGEKEPPFDLSPLFLQAVSPDGLAYPLPAVHDEIAAFIENLRPASALQLIQESKRSDLGLFKVEALRELDRGSEAEELIETLLPQLEGDSLARLMRFKAQSLLSKGEVDQAIWMLEQAAGETTNDGIRAAIIADKSSGYAIKRCFTMAQAALHQALLLSPYEPRVHFAESRLLLMMDRRLEARAVIERMPGDSEGWVNCYIDLTLTGIALLLGEFEEAERLARSALAYSAEIIYPLLQLIELALLKGDLQDAEKLLGEVEARSPQAEQVPSIRKEIERQREHQSGVYQERLKSFPSLVQRRDHCGPCTIELVLRYWKGGLDLTNTEIARRVMYPQGGTPLHRMTEFFHLLGFDTLRCIASIEKLKLLVDEGFPAIVEERAAGQSHVTVVIGYDDEAGTIELQDPVTHHVLPVPVADFERLRLIPNNSAVLAFPAGDENRDTVARLGLHRDEVLTMLDQASIAFDQGNLPFVANLMQQATRISPENSMAWIFRLEALFQMWSSAVDRLGSSTGSENPKDPENQEDQQAAASIVVQRSEFFAAWEQARLAHPQAEFCAVFEGRASLLDRDLPRALLAFQKALEIEPNNADTLAAIAQCQFGLRNLETALENARQAVKRDPGSVTGNIWLAYCLSELEKEHAEFYARVGLELAPTWWLAHLVMANVCLRSIVRRPVSEQAFPTNQMPPEQEAWKEINLVLAAIPNQPDALVLRAVVMLNHGDYKSAQSLLEQAQKTALDQHASPMTIHSISMRLCVSFFNQGMFEQAAATVQDLLLKEPGDHWALMFQASVEFEKNVRSLHQPAPDETPAPEFQPAIDLYLSAIEAGKGDPAVVETFLNYLARAGKNDEALRYSKSLSEQYPEQPNLLYQHAMKLAVAEQKAPAAELMLEAIAKENAVPSNDDLSNAFNTIIQGMGVVQGENAILNATLPSSLTIRQRNRSLGLVLSGFRKERGERARQLLEDVLAHDPEDAEVIFWLGISLAVDADERERLLREAVSLAPHWAYARSYLLYDLIQKGETQDALDLSRGHEGESLVVLNQQTYCLNSLGYYEEASQAAERLLADFSLPGERTTDDYYMAYSAHLNSGAHARSLEVAQKALALFPDELAWRLHECLAYCNLDQLEEAEAALKKGMDKGLSNEQVLEGRYWIDLCRKLDNDALDLSRMEQVSERKKLSQNKEGDASLLITWSNRYLGLLAYLGREEETRQYLDMIFQDHRLRNLAPWIISNSHLNQLALEYSKRVLSLPNVTGNSRYNALLGRAVACRNLDDPKALQYFEQLGDEFPRYCIQYVHLACYAALDGDLEKAASLAEQAIATSRWNSIAWASRGLVHFLAGERTAAIETLRRGWIREPSDQFGDYIYWWLYFTLEGDAGQAEEWKTRVFDHPQSNFERRLVELIQSKLGQE